MENKYCNHCGFTLPIKSFYKDKQKTDGYSSYCKEYYKELSKKWHKENKEHVCKLSKKRHLKNKEKRNQQNKEWYIKNRKVAAK